MRVNVLIFQQAVDFAHELIVFVIAQTDRLAWTNSGADAAALAQGFGVLAGVDQRDVALDADVGRTGGFAGRYAAFGYAISAWNRLGIHLKDGFVGVQALVVLIGHLDGADLGAIAAAGAFLKIDETRIFAQFCGEVSRVSFKGEKFGAREQFYIQMPADLDQFR